MSQDEIYRVLLELKESSGKIEAKVDGISSTLATQLTAHQDLDDKHELLAKDVHGIKTKVILVSGSISALFTGLIAYLIKKFS